MAQAASPWVAGPRVHREGASGGPLAGLRFAAKDNFDVAGHVTGAGSPAWRATHGPARETAPAITRLLASGATLVGKTQMDELAWGTLGDNPHDGAPPNPRAPERLPGGSSSGSASVVAAGEVDFALGSDTACSVRLPAAACGVFGLRPTHARVDAHGLLPLSPSLDTVGWMARDAATLAAVGGALLEGEPDRAPLATLLVATDAFALVEPESASPLRAAAAALRGAFAETREIEIGTRDDALASFWLRVWSVEVRECWALHGEWLARASPLSRGLEPEHLLRDVTSGAEAFREARAHLARLRAHVRALVPPGVVLCLPTSAGPAPLRSASREERIAFVLPSLCLCSVAGAGGLPQLQLPVETGEGPPLGISLVGAPGADEALLAHAAAHFISPLR